MSKKVFVTITVEGKKHTLLCNAKLVGKHYQIDSKIIDALLARLNIGRCVTFSIG